MSNTTRLPALRSLRAFQMAGKHLSFKKAADELFLTASAVSHQVKNLEAFLGLELFYRKTRSMELTPAGQQYFRYLDGMFARLETETHQLWAEYGRRMIRLCVPPFFASEILLPNMAEFQSIMPDTDIRVSTQPSLMKEHPADVDLSVLLGNGEWADLVTYPLFERRLVVAAAPKLLKKFDRSTERSLDGQVLIIHENRPSAWSNWAAARGVDTPKASKILRFDSMSSVVQATVQGLGFAIVSWPLSRRWFESNALGRAFDDEWPTGEHFYLAHRPGDPERLEIVGLVDWIRKRFHEDA
ncbi:MAG: LysR substrate-binding domain-containing protein [Pseudomonadota bacterium]